MKKATLILAILICISSVTSCSIDDSAESASACGTHNGNTLYTGPEGGCYYYNSNDNKTYVDRSECNC